MTYHFSHTVITLGLYSASNKINQYIFKEKENIIINTFIFSFFFVIVYLINSYLFILTYKWQTFFLLICCNNYNN